MIKEDNDFKWYVIYVSSSSESVVKNSILDKARKDGLQDYFDEIIIPSSERERTSKSGEQIIFEQKATPGYILIKMKMNDQSWSLVRLTNKVSSFLGNGKCPSSISQKEVDKMLSKINSNSVVKAKNFNYDLGEIVKVMHGPFESFSGTIDEIDFHREKVMVSVSIFGRVTPLELGFDQIEKI